MTPVELSRTVLRAMRAAADAGELRVCVPEDAGAVPVERPRAGGCGDYATSVALRVAREARMPPLEVAEVLSPWLAAQPGIAGVDISGPGFLNVTLAGAPAGALVREIAEAGLRYGHAPGDSRQLTPGSTGQPAPRDSGPHVHIHVPREVRALVVADSVRRILRSQGALVRVTCDAAPDAAWVDVLGVRVDAHGRPPADHNTPQPVPALAPGDHGTPHPVPAPAPGGQYTPRPTPAPGDPLRLGRDAARWALLHPAAHDRARVTPEQGGDRYLEQREGNPLFRVQYAHARCRALTRNAADLGFTAVPGDTPHPLLAALADYPTVLAVAARHRAPDRVARQLVVVADGLLAYQHVVLPRGEEKPSAAHRARLALAEAAGTVLAGGLSLLGISAPEYL